eukprot:jgi/Mesvir1/24825/Mv22065-RA.1
MTKGRFTTRRPKDAEAGLHSAFNHIFRGYAAGFEAFASLPHLVAKGGGAKGFPIRLLSGVATAVALPVAGLAVGLCQFGRGILNTPEAIEASNAGKTWEPEKGIWYEYRLSEEAEEVRAREQANEYVGAATVADNRLYDALGVATTATRAEIKDAHCQRAPPLHPRNHPNDPEARARFRQVSAAYWVLSDSRLRARYDAEGTVDAAVPNGPVGSELYFDIVFGTRGMEPWAGQAWLATLTQWQEVEPSGEEKARRKQRRRCREVACAVHLRDVLAQYVEGQVAAADRPSSVNHAIAGAVRPVIEAAFRAQMWEEARHLASTPFGGSVLAALAHIFEEQAVKFLHFKFGLTTMREKAHAFKSRSRFQGAIEEVARAGTELDVIATKIRAVWFFSILEVEEVARAACVRLFRDLDVSLGMRRARAQGLLIIARVFKEHSRPLEVGMVALQDLFIKRLAQLQGTVD